MIGLIWAQARHGVIGVDGDIPWQLPEDQRRFRALTMGGTVLMGRRTWESLPAAFRPLPGRHNVVLTRDGGFLADGAEVVHTAEDGVAAAGKGDLWVIGGGAVYAALLEKADVLEVTEVDLDVAGDTHAPEISGRWRVAEDGGWQRSRTGLRYRFLSYRHG